MAGRVVVAGATGQIGRPLSSELIRTGHAVSVFTRDCARARRLVPGAADFVEWDPGSSLSAECAGHLAAADAVAYLTAAMGALHRRPGTLIAASSVGYYGFAGHSDEPVSETSPRGQDWWGTDSATVEQAALGARRHGIRTVVLRTGYVLTQASLASQLAQFRLHFGGWIGTGQGWTPWIHIADEVGIIIFALGRPQIDGPVNLTAPAPVRSRQFAQSLGQVLGRRAWLPIPSPFVRMGLGAVTDILVRGKRVLPAKAADAGYQFRFPALEPALGDILHGKPGEE